MSERTSFRKTAAQFEEFARETEVPQAMRDLAERNIAQMRETYERSKDALEGVLQSWERSFDAAGQGAVALNRISTLLSATSIQASTLQRAWPGQKTSLRPWKCSHPIGAANLIRSLLKPKRCALYRHK